MTNRFLLGALCLALPLSAPFAAQAQAQAQTSPSARTEMPAVSGATKAGPLTIETPWLRATPNGAKVAGGYVRITNAGAEPDRLVGAAIPQAGRGEIHSMSMEGGVMRMAPVEGGLAIAPGQTVTLAPGGLHLMFLDLTGPLKAGASQPGTLTFERAGTVPVSFAVAPIGARSPDAAPAAHDHRH